MHCWLGWQSCSSRSHSSTSALVGEEKQGDKRQKCGYVEQTCCDLSWRDHGVSVGGHTMAALICTCQLKIPHHADSCLLPDTSSASSTSRFLIAGSFLKEQQLFSCEILQIPQLSACPPPWTRTHSHPLTDPTTCCLQPQHLLRPPVPLTNCRHWQ